jgi:hypothetical protein
MKTEHVNRYNDTFTFTDLPDGNILWEGNFQFCRFGYPNVYTKAYQAYFEKECTPPNDHTLSLKHFKEEVHRQIYDENDEWVEPCRIAKEYAHLVEPDRDTIDMVDPSGGPYLTAGMKVHKKIIKEFKPHKEGYLIITEKDE